jgi:hypothetical protein
MSWHERMRRLTTLAPWTALLLAIGCGGGGDKNPTGPGGGSAELKLASIGRIMLPADAQLEDCALTRFYGGRIELDQQSGHWLIHLDVHDANYGDWGYGDEGQLEVDGTTTWFDSQISGVSYQGTMTGSQVTIMYDWCFNGVPDMQLVFDR